MKYYILDADGEPVPCDNLEKFGRWFETAERRVCRDYDEGDEERKILVSTVFLGIDHNFTESGPPVLWETMVFGGPLDQEQDRYTSRDAAILGHQRMCERVMQAVRKLEGEKPYG